jgi:hypothetical protein
MGLHDEPPSLQSSTVEHVIDVVLGFCRAESVTLHTPYPLHLTTVRTYTPKLPVLLKGGMTPG